MRSVFWLLLMPTLSFCQTTTEFGQPPEWASRAIWYELFVERFHNGDKTNDPTLEDITVPGQSEPPRNWQVSPWTGDWYTQEPWAKATGRPLDETVFFRRYGGELQG